MYLNEHTYSGNLGRDAVLRDAGDTKVLSFSVANTSPFGQKVTTWYNVSVFGRQAETLAPMLLKGTRVIVIGEDSLKEYTDKNGNTQKSLETRARSVQLVDPPRNNTNDDDEGADDSVDGDDFPF